MNPLRDQIAQALTQADIDADVDLEGPGYYHKQAGYVLALVADPELRMLWLDALGLELFTGTFDELARLIAAGHIAVVRPRAEATMSVFGVRGTGQPKWGVKLVVPKKSINVECYGETLSEALIVLADALGPDEYSTLRWAAEHQDESDA